MSDTALKGRDIKTHLLQVIMDEMTKYILLLFLIYWNITYCFDFHSLVIVTVTWPAPVNYSNSCVGME
jgi:hypothetical protein